MNCTYPAKIRFSLRPTVECLIFAEALLSEFWQDSLESPKIKLLNIMLAYEHRTPDVTLTKLKHHEHHTYPKSQINLHNTDIFYRLIIRCMVRLDPRPRFTICTCRNETDCLYLLYISYLTSFTCHII